ncbi:MAG: VWA domain-containing protein [Gemmatimonadota bacterium]|nr:VWA domain-containing protein [Gemmatimonadota bacterium]
MPVAPSIRAEARRLAADERGGILAFVAVAMIMMLASTGLAVDLGRGYVERMRLGRAVDAGSLAAARALRLGQAVAQNEADAVARANGIDGTGGVATSVVFGVNNRGENTVTMRASRTIPTTFMKVLGRDDMSLGVAATAAVPPIDLVLVLDQSGSLGATGSFGQLQNAAQNFVGYFDDSIDQLGLVSFQVVAADRFQLAHSFSGMITTEISNLSPAGDTNMGEALRLASLQMQRPNVRPSSGKVVVFFTDGRATALRGPIGPPGNPADRVIAVESRTSTLVRGYFDNPDQLPLNVQANPDGCSQFPQCWGWDEPTVRAQSAAAGLGMAHGIRDLGAAIYVVALGDPDQTDPLMTPDLPYLQAIANEGGIVSGSQPQGRVFFAPTASELQQMFDLVAQDLLVRLSG